LMMAVVLRDMISVYVVQSCQSEAYRSR
jgi:hypothetical protein